MKAPATRNAPCPCGSGRRYKDCHGGLGPSALAAAARSDPRQLIAQGLDAIAREDLPAAESAARAVHAIDPKHPDASHILALVGLLREDHSGALDACDRAIAVLPSHAPFHVSRARALLGLGRHADAERSVRHALALDPGDPAAWTLLGRTLLAPDRAETGAGTDRPAARGGAAAEEA